MMYQVDEIEGISASASEITLRVRLDGAEAGADVTVPVLEGRPHAMALGGWLSAGPAIEAKAAVKDGAADLTIPRFDGARDRIYSPFRVGAGDETRYVTQLDGIADYDAPYPKIDSIKGLQVRDVEDAVSLGVRHAAINLNQPCIAVSADGPDVSTWEMDGETYYFDEAYLREFDKQIKTLSDNGINVSLILLCHPEWHGVPIRDDMREILLHPNYNPEGFISAFNVVTEQGYRHYKAFVEFVAARYSRPDEKHGRVTGYIIGNEIDSAWVWGNAGELSAGDYIKQYAVAMRTAFYAARKQWSAARVYISLTHLWTIPHLDNPLRCYTARECLERLNAQTVAEGNWDWSLAFHPYPENLFYADFWNDASATDTIDSKRITFRNIDVLPRFMAREEFLFDGRPRSIILSEQGFHSERNEESEGFHAAAYALAFEKVAAQPAIEAFIYHAHVDNLKEFGLNLGLWRIDEEGNKTTPKPAYEVFKAAGTPAQQEAFAFAKAYLDKAIDRAPAEEKLF